MAAEAKDPEPYPGTHGEHDPVRGAVFALAEKLLGLHPEVEMTPREMTLAARERVAQLVMV